MCKRTPSIILLILITIAAFLLASCTPLDREVVTARRQMNDAQARATILSTCDISLGAWLRALSPEERQAVFTLCASVAHSP